MLDIENYGCNGNLLCDHGVAERNLISSLDSHFNVIIIIIIALDLIVVVVIANKHRPTGGVLIIIIINRFV